MKSVVKSGVNGLLGVVGLQIVRVPGYLKSKNPALKSIDRGLSTKEHNSKENMDAIYADPDIEAHYFTPGRLKFYSDVERELRRLQLSPNSVLDVGCGSGHLLKHVSALYPNAEFRGVDFSTESIRLAKRMHPLLSFEEMSIFELEKTGKEFDLILCTEVLEHLEDADVAMAKLVSQCRDGGTIVITVPHGRMDTFEGHFNFWTPESFSREFRHLQPSVDTFGAYLFAVIRKSAQHGRQIDGSAAV